MNPEKVDNKTKFVVVRENVRTSIIKDTYTFGVLLGALAFNHYLLNAAAYTDIFILIMFLIWVSGNAVGNKKTVFTGTADDCIDWLDKVEAEARE